MKNYLSDKVYRKVDASVDLIILFAWSALWALAWSSSQLVWLAWFFLWYWIEVWLSVDRVLESQHKFTQTFLSSLSISRSNVLSSSDRLTYGQVHLSVSISSSPWSFGLCCICFDSGSIWTITPFASFGWKHLCSWLQTLMKDLARYIAIRHRLFVHGPTLSSYIVYLLIGFHLLQGLHRIRGGDLSSGLRCSLIKLPL